MATDVDLDLDPAELLKVLAAFRKGDFRARMPIDRTGLGGKIADALNDALDLASTLLAELGRVAGVVGKEGRINQRAELPGAAGDWAAMIGHLNGLVGDLVQPMTDVSRVIGAVAQGDLTQSVAHEVEGRPLKGEFLRTAKAVNGMVDQLGGFASEVSRVAREVGIEGRLGGQANVPGAAGLWRNLTDNVNSLAGNLTSQVRAIAEELDTTLGHIKWS